MSEVEIQYIHTCAKHITQLISKIGLEHLVFEVVVLCKAEQMESPQSCTINKHSFWILYTLDIKVMTGWAGNLEAGSLDC